MVTRLFRRVDNSPLIVFRMLFGLMLFCESAGAIATGWVKRTLVDPPFTFNFIGFDFLQPLPGPGMYFYFGLMAASGLMVLFGYRYRLGIASFTLLWTGVYLMQKSSYNNHYYLLLLLCFLMALVPANRYASLDVKRNPALQRLDCPAWAFWIFIAQMWIVYTYAGLNKLYPDWLSGRFTGILLSGKDHYPLLGPLYGREWFQSLITYGGLLFDLSIVPLLLWRKTRPVAFAFSCLFHLFNSATFQIGIFPYLSIALNIFFFRPETIRRLFLKKKPPFTPFVSGKLQGAPAPSSYEPRVMSDPVADGKRGKRHLVLYGLGIYFIVQLLLPARHLLFPGNVHWTEEGHRMSWRMMLRTKSGHIRFEVRNPATGERQAVWPREHMSPKQARKLAVAPDMIWQYAQRLKREYAEKGVPDAEVYAIGKVSLNSHPPRPLVDPEADLARVKWGPFRHSEWILPMKDRK